VEIPWKYRLKYPFLWVSMPPICLLNDWAGLNPRFSGSIDPKSPSKTVPGEDPRQRHAPDLQDLQNLAEVDPRWAMHPKKWPWNGGK